MLIKLDSCQRFFFAGETVSGSLVIAEPVSILTRSLVLSIRGTYEIKALQSATQASGTPVFETKVINIFSEEMV